MHVGRSHGRRRLRPIDAISGGLCTNGYKKVSVYYVFLQRTGHAILHDSINKRASINFDIGELEHRWIQRRVEGFRGSGSSVAVLALLGSCRLCPIIQRRPYFGPRTDVRTEN